MSGTSTRDGDAATSGTILLQSLRRGMDCRWSDFLSCVSSRIYGIMGSNEQAFGFEVLGCDEISVNTPECDE